MAFSIESFSKLRTYGEKTVYVYNTVDTMSAVMAAGYFNNIAPNNALVVGDMVLCSIDTDGTPDVYTLLVTDVTSGVVTVSAGDRLVIPIDLLEWREGSSGSLQNLAAVGGLLATDSTPIANATNGDTDGTIRLNWAASDSNPIICQKALPDLDGALALELHVIAKMTKAGGSLVDTPTLSLDSYFAGPGVTSAKITDVSSAVGAQTYTEYVITIAAADIDDAAVTASFELTPGAHTTDSLQVCATWLEGYRKRLV